MRSRWFLAGALVACAPEKPTELADCQRPWLGSGRRQDCVGRLAVEVARRDPEAAGALVEAEIHDPLARDFVYLQLTQQVDSKSDRYCKRIRDDVFSRQCRERIQRPHLDRPAGAPAGLPPASRVPASRPPAPSPGAGG
jgi:hypothetical protein